jgi:hypothetical protein
MKISVSGYNSFHDTCAELGSPIHVFYCQSGSSVFKALAIFSGEFYVEGVLSGSPASVSTFTEAYPGAVEVVSDVKGEF